MLYPFTKRALAKKINALFAHFPCVIVTGARQVGKSTLLTHLFPDLQHIVFDPIQDVMGARQDPDLFLKNNRSPMILDEIQYAPELVPAIKRHIDQTKQPGMFLLTGSQQWGVMKNIAESLAGRAMIVNLAGFSIAELAQNIMDPPWLERWLIDPEAFLNTTVKHFGLKHAQLTRSLTETLWRGFLPEAHFIELQHIADFHAAYQRTYIERDIRLLAEISDLQLFGRFVKLLAALTAQEINYSQLGREIGITPQTAQRWTTLLIQNFEWIEIPAYSNNAIKKVSSKAKGYFTDTGQVCFSQMLSSPQAMLSHPLWGAIFETAVVNELRKQASLIATPPQMYHWRFYSGAECDLILERDGKLFPIEIKANSHPSKKDAQGLQAFREKHKNNNVQKGLIIAPTSDIYPVTETDYVLPWDIL